MPKPKDLTRTVDFLEARQALLENPVRDTIRDTIQSDTTIIGQDTLVRDTAARDTLAPDTGAVEEIVSRETQLDTSLQQDTIPAPADTTRTGQPPAAAEARPRPEPRQTTRTPEPPQTKQDTTADLYDILGVTQLPISDRLDQDPAHHNFLYHIPAVRPSEDAKTGSIYQPTPHTPETTELQAHSLQEIPAKKEQQESYDWVTLILAGSLLLIGWTRLFFKNYFISLVKSFHFYNYAANLYFGRNSLTERAGILLNLNFFLTGGLVLFQALHNSPYSLPLVKPVYLWLLFAGFLLAWMIWNFMMTRFIGFLFLRQRAFNEYFHNYNLYRKLMGISLMPVAVIVQFIRVEYREYFLLLAGVVVGVLFIVHIMRGLQVFMKEKVSIFYLFLYLCALEILPLYIVFQVFIRTLSS